MFTARIIGRNRVCEKEIVASSFCNNLVISRLYFYGVIQKKEIMKKIKTIFDACVEIVIENTMMTWGCKFGSR